MRLVMTLMVRDEADILGAMLTHHAAQGVDLFIVTDNGSVDGTVEILEEFSRVHEMDLRHDPVHRKQQSSVVTEMARDAHRLHGADWVINADADEFWVPTGEGSVKQALANVPTRVGTFQVPVIDLTGNPALSGAGFDRLIWRDCRPESELHSAGLHAHSSPNAVHVGDSEIVVSQGNHEVNRPSGGIEPTESGIEVLHLPWRSWDQFSRKVRNSGQAYEANPEIQPSPNHHGMRDYRRWKEGTLLSTYVARHPSPSELDDGRARGWFTEERRLAQERLPSITDVDLVDIETLRAQGRAVIDRELDWMRILDEERAEKDGIARRLLAAETSLEEAREQIATLESVLSRSPFARITDRFRRKGRSSEPRP